MMQTLLPHDLTTGTWFRVRTRLVQELWRARASLEDAEDTVLATQLRERIRFVKEILGMDPKCDDYSLRKAQRGESLEHLAAGLNQLPGTETGDQ